MEEGGGQHTRRADPMRDGLPPPAQNDRRLALGGAPGLAHLSVEDSMVRVEGRGEGVEGAESAAPGEEKPGSGGGRPLLSSPSQTAAPPPPEPLP